MATEITTEHLHAIGSLEDDEELLDKEGFQALVRQISVQVARVDEEAEARGEVLRLVSRQQDELSARLNLLSSDINSLKTEMRAVKDLLHDLLFRLSAQTPTKGP